MPRRPPVSDAELDVLKVLWKHGPGTVREVNARLVRRKRRWAYTTVRTLLIRLLEKGYVASEESGIAHVFQAAITREGLLRQRLSKLVDEVCDGTATPLVQALVQGRGFSADEIESFQRLVDGLIREERRSGVKPSGKNTTG